MTTTEEQWFGEETSKEQSNRCSNKEHKDSRNMTTTGAAGRRENKQGANKQVHRSNNKAEKNCRT